MAPMKRLVLLLCASCLPVLAADPPKPGAFSTSLEPGRIHEECARVEKGERRNYHWKSDAAVDFNIHRHEGNDVGADYCWMWTARDKRVKLEGGIAP